MFCEAYLWQWGILALHATLSCKGSSDRNPDTETAPRKGSGDSLGIIRINVEMWNKEMSHHNTDQLFISILCFTRWISRVIMNRRGCRSLLPVMTDIYALVLYAPVGRAMMGEGHGAKETHLYRAVGAGELLLFIVALFNRWIKTVCREKLQVQRPW